MHARQNVSASYRPKTSSALDDGFSRLAVSTDPEMKRTASQTFTTSHYNDGRERDMGVLDAVREGPMYADCGASQHSHSSSLSRAFGVLSGPFSRQGKEARRRLSSFSSFTSTGAGPSRRRGSFQSLFDRESLHPSTSNSKSSIDQQRAPLQHQDSGIPPFVTRDLAYYSPHTQYAPAPSNAARSSAFVKRIRNMRTRPRDPDPAPPHVTTYPSQSPLLPGAAARSAAAAARKDRSQRERELDNENTRRFLSGLSPANVREGEIMDNESGIDMTYAPDSVPADCVADKKMMDPFERLPAELATVVLSNLDAESLESAERVSPGWERLAKSPHVWRNVYLRRYEPEVHVSPAPIQMGGTGIGRLSKNQPVAGQDWREMYAAREEINKRWNAQQPAAIYMNGHTDSVYCCQFDEHKAITGSRDRTIRVWDLQTYECVKVYGGPNHRPTANTPPPLEERPERVISNPSLNGTKAGNDIYVIPADYHDASILCLQYDNEIMVTGSSDFTCIVWDVTGDDYVPMHRLRGHDAGVLDVCLDDKYIISCSKDSTIKVWDRKTGTCLRTLKGHRGPVNAVQLRGNFLVSASGDGVAKLWNLETGVSIKDFHSEDRGLAAVEFSDDAKFVLAGGNDHVVYKFDAATGKLVHSRVKHEGLVRSLFLDAFNGRIVSGSYDQSIQVSDYNTGAQIALYKNWTTSWILSAKSDYRRVVATSQDGRILILDFGWDVKGAHLLAGTSTAARSPQAKT